MTDPKVEKIIGAEAVAKLKDAGYIALPIDVIRKTTAEAFLSYGWSKTAANAEARNMFP